MENNPRAVFERLFGDSDSTEPAARQARMAQRPQHPRFGHRERLRPAAHARTQRRGAADRVPRRRCATSSAAFSEPRPTAAPRAPGRRTARRQHSGIVRGVREGDVRPAGARVSVRRDAHHHLHDRQGAQRPDLSGDRRARSASPAVAPPERSREAGQADQGEHVPRVAARLLPREAAVDARRRGHPARSAHARSTAAA